MKIQIILIPSESFLNLSLPVETFGVMAIFKMFALCTTLFLFITRYAQVIHGHAEILPEQPLLSLQTSGLPTPLVVSDHDIEQRFAVIIDAGSSGSRVHVYSSDRRLTAGNDDILPSIRSQGLDGASWTFKQTPGEFFQRF